MTLHQSTTAESAVAIVGLACRFPGARNAAEFWENLIAGRESITAAVEPALPARGRGKGHYVPAGAFLDDIEKFDAAFFGIAPAEARILDPQHRILLECAWEAFEDAGYDIVDYPHPVGVFAGARTDTYLLHLASQEELVESLGAFQIGLGNDIGFLSTRIAHKLNLRGPAISVQTACSTALVAVHLACQSLLAGECRMAIAGAVAVDVPHFRGYRFEYGSIFSPDGHCRPFDEAAQGTVFGSGAGLVVVKRLDNAILDRDRIYAVIRSSAVNNDGSVKAGFTAPSVNGQASAIAAALDQSGVSPEDISYVEAHGTGTALGDPIEVRALTKVFRRATDRIGYCGLGSVKASIGHLDAAAGIASLIKTVLAIERRQLPPTLHFTIPNRQMDLANSPFYVVADLREWDAPFPRRAGVSSFGVGGTNAHLVLEEAMPRAVTETQAKPAQLLVLSANSESAVEASARRLAEYLRNTPSVRLADAAYSLQVARRAFPYRAAVAASSLDSALGGLGRVAGTVRYSDVQNPDIAFLFPGQGVQRPGMMGEHYQWQPAFRATMDRIAEILLPDLGLDIRSLLYATGGSSAGDLNETLLSQPALFACEYACAKLWERWGVTPAAVAGHSLGEYVAACIAGVFSLGDALRLIVVRARCMQAAPPGAMLALRLTEAEALGLAEGNIRLAAVNAPCSCVLSGPVEEIEALCAKLGTRTAMHRLPAQRAFHAGILTGALDEFREVLRTVHLESPRIPLASNLTGTWLSDKEATDHEYWLEHTRRTVRFSDCLARMLEYPGRILLEAGPGVVLSGLAREQPGYTPEGLVLSSSPQNPHSHSELETMLASLGELWKAGTRVDWSAVHEPDQPVRIALPSYPFERERFWVDSSPAPTAAEPADGKQADVSRWFYAPSWRRLPLLESRPATAAPARRLLFARPSDPLAGRLRARLEAAGESVVLAIPGRAFRKGSDLLYELDPESPADYRAILEEVAGETGLPPVAYLWSLDGQAAPSPLGFQQPGAIWNLLLLTQALVPWAASGRVDLTVVSDGLYEVEGGDRIHPEKGPLLGVCWVLPQENSQISCRNIDVRVEIDPEILIRRMEAEIRLANGPRVIALRGNRRWEPGFEPLLLAQPEAGSSAIRPGGVYVLTGGLGAIGLLIGRHLAPREPKLVLLSRSSLPPRNQWESWLAGHDREDPVCRRIEAIREMEQAGAEVSVLVADVADEEAMAGAFQAMIKRYGRIDGVFHLAGITAGESVFQSLEFVSREQLEAQFRPKVHGVRILDRVLRSVPVDFVVLFSSNSAVLGGLGLTSYAAANLFMDAFASSRADNPASVWLSVNWDQWAEETKRFKGYQTSVDQYVMTAEESLDALDRILARRMAGQLIVSTGDLPSRYRRWRENATPAAREIRQPVRVRHDADFTPPATETEQVIAGIWQSVLGVDRVGIHESFFDLDGDSLMATRIVGMISEAVGVEVQLGTFFKGPTIAELATAADLLRQTMGSTARPKELLRGSAAADRAPAKDC